ncbi:transcriptional regulator, GntR family [Bradyrhizobium sp. NFR13]|jgi:GntR family transcriptional regulator/MocR family aminotransferase|uniref:MocR-like pyridoxine biosynthesis transcription factor PdxR n=1 Tax=Bradyrhizobium sp. NFR13 TaxID=1566285 RepID=UPI0008E51874|nr:PLP-dependent aminotransferase family protein [Bradyrhizobium sp. NFR13]SFL99423.1 transcriptional regulator, GntR family [Bradyrhizobium sp. NFR13]
MGDILAGLIDIERGSASGETLTRQLYDQLRAAILSGALPPGHRLPSSRDCALQLGIARNTVSAVIDQLAMEGYLDVAQGRRPTVAAAERQTLLTGRNIAGRAPKPLGLSRWAERVRKSDWPFVNKGPPQPLATVLADSRLFPHDIWARCLRRAARRAPTGDPAINRASLRTALLRHLTEHRGVRAEARQIIIMPSAQASLELIARVLLDAGDLAWVESPGYGGARAALDAAGASVRGIALDRGGLAFKGRRDRPRLIFVTPSHQHPTGRLMPVSRRQQLLGFANDIGAAIVEDDYDSEFHYDGRPVAALQGLDDSGRVFYVGTFSKSMFSDVRSGYAIVPPDLADLFEKAQRHGSHIVPAPVQDALAEFIDDGHFAAHIRKMTRVYRSRRDHLLQALRMHAGDHLTIEPPAGGMQLLAYLNPQYDDRTISARLAELGVTARPLSMHFAGPASAQGLFLGFAAWNEREIDKAAAIIGQVLRDTATPRGRSGKAPKRPKG